MTETTFPAQDIECPHPAGCPVAADEVLAAAPKFVLTADEQVSWWRCYDSQYGRDEPNPGFGDTRFGPFDDADGRRVPFLYFAETEVGALLESVFHSSRDGQPVEYEVLLREHNLVSVRVPKDLHLVDLRDPALDELGLDRSAVSSTSDEHYPCTRRVARALHGLGAQGIIWHSRQAELRQAAGLDVDPAEVIVVFTDRAQLDRGSWNVTGSGSISLLTPEGRTHIDRLSEQLGITLTID